jgi:hypothetical protein
VGAATRRLNTDWVNTINAARLLSISQVSVKKVAKACGIRVRVVPGLRGRRYNRHDVEAVVSRMEAEEAAALKSTVKPKPARTVAYR